jgi:hypothetical protein
MKSPLKLAFCAFALAAATACGSGRGPDGLTGEESEKLNKAAESLDNGGVSFDAADGNASDEWGAAEAGEAGNANDAVDANSAQ